MELLAKLIQELSDDELRKAFNEIESWRKTGQMTEGIFRTIVNKFKQETKETLRFNAIENEFLYEMARRSYSPQSSLISTFEGYTHIIQQVGVCSGRPVIKGTRLEPHNISRYGTVEEVFEDWPYLTREQILEAKRFYKENIDSYKAE